MKKIHLKLILLLCMMCAEFHMVKAQCYGTYCPFNAGVVNIISSPECEGGTFILQMGGGGTDEVDYTVSYGGNTYYGWMPFNVGGDFSSPPAAVWHFTFVGYCYNTQPDEGFYYCNSNYVGAVSRDEELIVPEDHGSVSVTGIASTNSNDYSCNDGTITLTGYTLCCTGFTGHISGGVFGSDVAFGSTNVHGSGTLTLDNVPPGTYTVWAEAQDYYNEVYSTSTVVTITEPSCHLSADFVVTPASCYGAIDGNIQITGHNSSCTTWSAVLYDSLNYVGGYFPNQWGYSSHQNGESASWSSVSGLHAGKYEITVSDFSGNYGTDCSQIYNIIVGPDCNIAGHLVSADNNEIKVEATTSACQYYAYLVNSEDDTLSWQGANSGDILTFSGLANGTYTIKFSTPGGNFTIPCTQELPVDLSPCTTAPATPSTISITGGSAKVCPGNTRTYTVTNVSGVNYTWTAPTGANINSGQGTNSISVTYDAGFTASGTLSVVAINACGTSGPRNLTINRNNPTATITSTGPTTFCKDVTPLTLTANSGTGLSYQWKKGSNNITGATNQSYIPAASATYKVIVTNNSGCTKTSTGVTVTVNSLPAATITPQGPTTFCSGGSVLLQANSGSGLTYQWKKGSNNISGATLNNYTATTAGTYKVIVTNAKSCSKTSSGTKVTVNCKLTDDETVANSLQVFPNPTNGMITIKFISSENQNCDLIIFDITGRELKRETISTTIGLNTTTTDLSAFTKGLYLLKIVSSTINLEERVGLQ